MSTTNDLVASTTTRVTIILNSSVEWPRWYAIVKSMAEASHVFQYINPELDEKPIRPPRPTPPKAQDINADVTSTVALTAAEQKTFEMLFRIQMAEKSRWTQEDRALQVVLSHINQHITGTNLDKIRPHGTDIYEILATFNTIV